VTTRQRILEAAIAEISERGIAGARTRSIAERAEVNNALVHYHFKSMDDLIAEAAAAVFAQMTDAAFSVLTTPSLTEGLDQMSEFVGRVDPNEPGWQALLEVMVNTPRNPRLGELVLGWLAEYRIAVRDRLDRAVAEGELPAGVDTDALSLALMALFDGLGLYGYVEPSFDVRRAGESIADLLRRLQQGENE
jgi:AcrR family transcriptional regulator